MADSTSSSSWLSAVQPILQFFIGIFGALAIIGVFFKIQGYPNTEIFMVLGFMGEAAAFVIMGSFALLSYFFEDEPARKVSSQETVVAARAPDAESQQVRAAFHDALEERVNEDLNVIMEALADEVRLFGQQMKEVSGELDRTRTAVEHMRGELEQVTDGRLVESADRLGQGMHQLGSEMEGAGHAVETMRTDLDEMARRFQHFNGLGAGTSNNNSHASAHHGNN